MNSTRYVPDSPRRENQGFALVGEPRLIGDQTVRPSERRTFLIALVLFVVGVFALGFVPGHAPEPSFAPSVQTRECTVGMECSETHGYYDDGQSACMEDDPCWDCHVMGNGQCGPRVGQLDR